MESGVFIRDFSQPQLPALQRLRLWYDPLPRDGYANMAADELLSRRPEAWLRVYSWAKPAVSYGYFDRAQEARRLFPGAEEYIRRWTGGGIVDHRSGWTYTLTLPARESAVYPESAALYAWIHGALADALQACGVPCSLLPADAPDGGRACWSSPVCSDITDAGGRKLAGAGQRRHAGAILHQGLVQGCSPTAVWPDKLAANLAEHVEVLRAEEPWGGFGEELHQLLQERYLAAAWTDEQAGRRYRS